MLRACWVIGINQHTAIHRMHAPDKSAGASLGKLRAVSGVVAQHLGYIYPQIKLLGVDLSQRQRRLA